MSVFRAIIGAVALLTIWILAVVAVEDHTTPHTWAQALGHVGLNLAGLVMVGCLLDWVEEKK